MTVEESGNTMWGNHLRLVTGSETASNADEICTSDVFFSKQIFSALILELQQCVKQFEKSPISNHGNLFRRGNRLVRLGRALEKETDQNTRQTLHAAPTPEVYVYLEELIPYFKDTGYPELAAIVEELIINEVVSEVITTLVVRPGRQTSAAVLAVYYGLVDEDDEAQALENAGITAADIDRYLYAAHLDIDEIAHELQYQGDYKSILTMARKKIAA